MLESTKWKKINKLDIFLTIFFIIVSVISLYPFWYVLVGSLIPYHVFMEKVLLLWPERPTLEAYQFVLKQGQIFDPLKVTIITTLIGTFANLLITTFVSYGLSKKFPGSTLLTYLIVFTMFVSAGLIPNYILFRQLRLLNSVGVYIIPYLINTFYLIIMRTYFSGFSHEIEEAAYIDGYNDFSIFFRVVLPLSKPMLAAIALFTAVDYWNTFSQSVYFVTDIRKKTLQDYLYMLLSDNAMSASGTGNSALAGSMGKSVFSQTIKLACTMISIVPILVVYPFLQKYFTSGILVGAIKG